MKSRHSIPVKVIILVAFICLATSVNVYAWLIDPLRYHISYHGQTMCTDCHYDIGDDSRHPKPERVNGQQSSFKDPEMCFNCHKDIADDMVEGIHAGKPINSKESFNYCIACHDPHEQTQIKLLPNEIESLTTKNITAFCSQCHEARQTLPILSGTEHNCLRCHSITPDQPLYKNQAEQPNFLCLSCHNPTTRSPSIESKIISVLAPAVMLTSSHSHLKCIECHPYGAGYEHNQQKTHRCIYCHNNHGERNAHDAHANVACEACHLEGVIPLKAADYIGWQRKSTNITGTNSRVHEFLITDKSKRCARCHYVGNNMGAAAQILPAKSLLCLPCHTGTLSLADPISFTFAMILFTGALLIFCPPFFRKRDLQPNQSYNPYKGVDYPEKLHNGRVRIFFNVLFFDILMQRPLYRRSKSRWVFHSLIFVPILMRNLWALVALTFSTVAPQMDTTINMINKNFPLTAIFFDFTGILLISGILLALNRDYTQNNITGLPKRDRFPLMLLLALSVIGFLLEGMRIIMTGYPENSGYAFLGFILAFLLPKHAAIQELYPCVWYLHATLCGIFLAYFPLSHMRHIIFTPITLMMSRMGHK